LPSMAKKRVHKIPRPMLSSCRDPTLLVRDKSALAAIFNVPQPVGMSDAARWCTALCVDAPIVITHATPLCALKMRSCHDVLVVLAMLAKLYPSSGDWTSGPLNLPMRQVEHPTWCLCRPLSQSIPNVSLRCTLLVYRVHRVVLMNSKGRDSRRHGFNDLFV
jgi:hypothetical protein